MNTHGHRTLLLPVPSFHEDSRFFGKCVCVFSEYFLWPLRATTAIINRQNALLAIIRHTDDFADQPQTQNVSMTMQLKPSSKKEHKKLTNRRAAKNVLWSYTTSFLVIVDNGQIDGGNRIGVNVRKNQVLGSDWMFHRVINTGQFPLRFSILQQVTGYIERLK